MAAINNQQLDISKKMVTVANEYIDTLLSNTKNYLKRIYDIPIMTHMCDTTQLIVIPIPATLYDNDDYCKNFEDIVKSVFNMFELQTINLEWHRYNYYCINNYRNRYWSINVAHHISFWVTPNIGYHRDIILPIREFHHTWDIDEHDISYTSYKENKRSIDEYFSNEINIGTITVCCYIKETIRTPPPSPRNSILYNSESDCDSTSCDSNSTDNENQP